MYDEAFVGIFAAFAGVGVIFMLIGLVNYVLISLGLMTMATNQGIENPWLAWIPIGNLWILGKIVRTIEFADKKYEKAEMILLIAAAASIVLSAIPLIGWLISLAVFVLNILVILKLYKMYAPENAVLYLILTIIFAIIAPGIIMFKIKDNTPVEV